MSHRYDAAKGAFLDAERVRYGMIGGSWLASMGLWFAWVALRTVLTELFDAYWEEQQVARGIEVLD
jgi:hypothetical protein